MSLPAGQLARLAPDTVVDPEGLARDLGAVRARGYAVAVEELEPGLWAVAAPVRDGEGSVIAALSISGPTLRLRDGLLDELGELTKREAEVVSGRLTYDERKRGAA
jgi:DNA-binding IclR family transcriptional regulator